MTNPSLWWRIGAWCALVLMIGGGVLLVVTERVSSHDFLMFGIGIGALGVGVQTLRRWRE
ncbi:MAG: hypothetical protein R3F54_08410 [Alphaproteobacteria bacterium]